VNEATTAVAARREKNNGRAGFILAFSGGPIATRYAPRAVKFQIVHSGR
jgi:hypothetical protein